MTVRLTTTLALAAALALSTAAGTWWTVPLACFAWGVARRAHRWHSLDAGLAAALAWGALLALVALRGPAALVARQVAGVTGAPAPVLVLLTLVFPFALGWSAARMGGAVGRIARRRDARVPETLEAGLETVSPARLDAPDERAVSAGS